MLGRGVAPTWRLDRLENERKTRAFSQNWSSHHLYSRKSLCWLKLPDFLSFSNLSMLFNTSVTPREVIHLFLIVKPSPLPIHIPLGPKYSPQDPVFKYPTLYILKKIKIKFVAYSSQGSHTGQLDFCNWLTGQWDNVISIMLHQV